jgi:hypothetical protein
MSFLTVIPAGTRLVSDFNFHEGITICGIDPRIAKNICDEICKRITIDPEATIKLQLNDYDILPDDSEENKISIPITSLVAWICYIITNYGQDYHLFFSFYGVSITGRLPETDAEIALLEHGVAMVLGKTSANPLVCAKLGWTSENIEAFTTSITLKKFYDLNVGYVMAYLELYMSSPKDFQDELAKGKEKLDVIKKW